MAGARAGHHFVRVGPARLTPRGCGPHGFVAKQACHCATGLPLNSAPLSGRETMRPKVPASEFANWLRSLPAEVIAEGNRREQEQTEQDWQRFRAAFKKGHCSLCDKPLGTFSADIPCLHWLLRPKRFKKKHFPLLYGAFTYFRIEAYVRWVAGADSPLKNVNDLKDEHPGDKLIDFTARYRHITWSISCGRSDLQGHINSTAGNFPHYHFQMQLDGRPFINYSDFHVPFHKDDLYDLELFLNHRDIARQSHSYGAGMSELLEKEDALEFIVKRSIPTDDEENAAFELSTVMMAPEGKTLSGEALYEAIQHAKASGKTIASVMRERFGDASITTIVSPGKGVPDPKPRTPRIR